MGPLIISPLSTTSYFLAWSSCQGSHQPGAFALGHLYYLSLLYITSLEAAISAHSEVTFFGASEAASQAQSSLGSRQLGAIGGRSDQLGLLRIRSLQLGASEVCYVEFVLERSPSVSVRLHLFPSVLRPSITFFPTILSFSIPFLLHPCPCYVSVYSISSFQPSTLGSTRFSKFQPRFHTTSVIVRL